MLLSAARVYHPHVLGFDIMQTQLIPLFGSFPTAPVPTSSASPLPISATVGPFWFLPLRLQHRLLQLFPYFVNLDVGLVQILLEVVRSNVAGVDPQLLPSNDANTVAAIRRPSTQSKLQVLDMIVSARHRRPSHHPNAPAMSLPHYLSFILGTLRVDHRLAQLAANAVSTENEEPEIEPDAALLTAACRMLADVSENDISECITEPGATLNLTPSSVLHLLTPMLLPCLTSSTPSSPPSSIAPLTLRTVLVLIESLLRHASLGLPRGQHNAGTFMSAELADILPATLYSVLSSALTSSRAESADMETVLSNPPNNWLDMQTPSLPTLGRGWRGRGWLLAMRILMLIAPMPSGTEQVADEADRLSSRKSSDCLQQLLHLVKRTLVDAAKQDDRHRNEARQAIIVLAALIKFRPLRPMLYGYRSQLLQLHTHIRQLPGLASQTLLASITSELTLLFGHMDE